MMHENGEDRMDGIGGRGPFAPDELTSVFLPLGTSTGLPARAYRSDEVFDWEIERLFDGSWVCVGRSADLSEPGDQTAARVGSETILLVRGADGILRTFFNTCRHRGHELLEAGERVCRSTVMCPYHAWVYDLDGRMRGAPGFSGLDRAEFGLHAARVEEWHGWAFVNPSGDAPPLAEHLGDLEDHVRDHEPERLLVGAEHSYVVESNWKIAHENYHECYHCSNLHPALCKVTPVESGLDYVPTGIWAGGNMELFDFAATMSFDGSSGGVPLRGLDERKVREVQYCHLFPNLLISAHPDYVMTHRLVPLSEGRTYIECAWLFPPEAFDRDGFSPAYAVDFWDVTNREDWGACESVQRAAHYRGFQPGPLSSRESTVYQAITVIARGYLDGHLSPPRVSPARLMDPAAAGGA
jgi:Rieske 2Fe-2S family protein